jgi:hypothetical protein
MCILTSTSDAFGFRKPVNLQLKGENPGTLVDCPAIYHPNIAVRLFGAAPGTARRWVVVQIQPVALCMILHSRTIRPRCLDSPLSAQICADMRRRVVHLLIQSLSCRAWI